MVELLVALLFVAAVLGGAIVAFVALQRHSQQTQARLTALGEARHALLTLSRDLAQAQLGPAWMSPPNFFYGANSYLSDGNRKDDDGDGSVDEEQFDGLDNDSDWQTADDRHVLLSGALYERPTSRGFPDFSDAHVDEDTKFTSASILFRMPAETTGTVSEVRYYVGTFDGQPNVLIRERITSGVTEAGPIAFNVLSFSALFWDGNQPPGPTRKWETSWDATTINAATQVPLPISVALEVSVYAGTKKLENIPPTDPLETIRLTTIVNIEAALNHPNYVRNSLP
ncbi:MAG: hypothetical protein N2Z21_02715 [Candidatus Sumerlaeaceae bacterium]|nr:hypothetical protein [Candidatus Sumerlaeaceae bacterium]